MPRQKLPQSFVPTSLEDTLAGRVADDTSFDTDDTFTSEVLQPRATQIREAGRGFNPKFEEAHDEEARFRLLDGTTDDDPYWRYLLSTIKQLRAARGRIRERERDGLLPDPSDVLELNNKQRGLNEVLPNLFRHGK